MLDRYFHALFARAPGLEGPGEPAATRAAVERVVEGVDPRLRALPRYRRTLWGPVERAFDYLIELIRQRVASTRARREQLEQQRRRLLRGQISVPGFGQAGGSGLGGAPFVAAVDSSDGRRLREIEDELGQLQAGSATLSGQLDLAAAMLGEAREHVRIDRVSMTLDLMNVKVPRDSPVAADTLTFNEMSIGADRRLTIEIIRFPSNQLLQPIRFETEAWRALDRPGRV